MGEQRVVVVVEAERREAAALQHAFADWRVPSPRPGCNPDPPPPPPPRSTVPSFIVHPLSLRWGAALQRAVAKIGCSRYTRSPCRLPWEMRSLRPAWPRRMVCSVAPPLPRISNGMSG